ncbi:hypothetical protein D9M68_540260 [compost metagenome]
MPARGRRAPAFRRRGPWWPALVRPRGRLPHRSAGPGQGAAGEERGDRAHGRQGRLHPAPPAGGWHPRRYPGRGDRLLPHLHLRPAGHYRQPQGRQGGAAGQRGTPRRRRPLPGGGRRQGHRDLLRHRQRHRPGLQLLAGRRLRLRRLGRLRPQGHGHHRQGRLGVGAAPLPRARHRCAEGPHHGDRYRRHGRRRVRQRHAAVGQAAGGGRVQPHAHLHRPEPGFGVQLRRAQAPVRPAALVLGRLRRQADLRGRRHLPACGQEHRHQPADAAALRDRSRQADPHRAAPCAAQGAGRPDLERRHRHLRQGQQRKPRRRRRQGQRCAARGRPRTARQGGGRGRQPRHDPARPRRVRPQWRRRQHRLHRQRRRRGLLGP